jgi:hypothetical protein
MRDYATNPKFAPRGGALWNNLDQNLVSVVPEEHRDVCEEVLPIFIQLHMDGVQVRKEFSFNPVTALHINATPYNAGEDLR